MTEAPDRTTPVYWCANGDCRKRWWPKRSTPVAFPMVGYPEASQRQSGSALFIYFHFACRPRATE